MHFLKNAFFLQLRKPHLGEEGAPMSEGAEGSLQPLDTPSGVQRENLESTTKSPISPSANLHLDHSLIGVNSRKYNNIITDLLHLAS